MACPDPSQLEAFCRGGLQADALARVERHLDACPDCAATVAQLWHVYGSASAGLGVTDVGAAPTIAAQGSGGLDDTQYAGRPGPATEAPMHVGRYQLGRKLGAGGMGMVFEAHDPQLHRLVAIKLLHSGVTDDAGATRDRLLHEARAMARLAHPNVVAVHDVGQVGEQIFIAMELVAGPTLGQWLSASRRSRAQILAAFAGAGRGLAAAHAVGLVHRDFKPDNVLMGPDARPRVTDFGLARRSTQWPTEAAMPGGVAGDVPTNTTTHGAIVGTPAYMAPEQWRGVPADARSDQFSFCVALYEALYGRRPFAGRTFVELSEAVLAGRFEPPRSGPRWLRALVARGLAVDPAARHGSMDVIVQALDRERGRALRIGAIAGAMGIGAVATAVTLGWIADSTVASPTTDDAAVAAEATDATEATRTEASSGTAREDPVATADVQACRERAKTADGAWTTERRAELANRIVQMEHATEVGELTISGIDGWVEGWAAAATKACDPDDAQAEARRRCLDRARDELDALVRFALELERFQVQDALAGAVHELPEPTRCGDETWLAARPAGATTPEAGRLWQALADARAQAALLQLVAAPGAATAVAEDAEKAGDAVLLAEAQWTTGQIAARRRQPDHAVTWLRRAVDSAAKAQDATVEARAAIALVEQEGAAQLKLDGGTRWQRIAARLVESLGDARLSADLALASARLLVARGEYEPARAELETVAAAVDVAYGADHPRAGEVRLEQSAVGLALADPAAAQRFANAAHEIFVAADGPVHLDVAAALAARAKAERDLGDLAAAEASADAAVHMVRVSASLRHDFDRGHWVLTLAEVLAAAGGSRDADAIAELDRAKIYLYEDAPKAEPLLARARFERTRGRGDEAVAFATEAVTHLETLWAADDPRLCDPLIELGRAQTTAGSFDDARTTLERAVGLADTSFGYGPRLALAQLALGDLERAAGDDERALKLYDDAHVPLVGAYGMDHPQRVRRLLDRADLAWKLGQTEYGGRLYRSAADRAQALWGAADPAVARALARRSDPE